MEPLDFLVLPVYVDPVRVLLRLTLEAALGLLVACVLTWGWEHPWPKPPVNVNLDQTHRQPPRTQKGGETT
jgi:hypothetical protein